ncbi:hypothetical protein AVEN_231773-1 [Araneus ventricosus]|uniref:Uncharacterized protein n=1 Tax=Araneus ventricosus TaxID=182803 RepID=A0A4Y2SQ37_ARAVE|nr:hypothetical protein AVEN_231773-1 [Araneus ventricosus]
MSEQYYDFQMIHSVYSSVTLSTNPYIPDSHLFHADRFSHSDRATCVSLPLDGVVAFSAPAFTLEIFIRVVSHTEAALLIELAAAFTICSECRVNVLGRITSV